MTDATRSFLTHLLPQGLPQTYPSTVPTSYIVALHPEATTPENVTNTIIRLALTWAHTRIGADRLSWEDYDWVSTTAGEIHYRQTTVFGRTADEEISRAVYRALRNVYGSGTQAYNDNDLPSVFGILLYLTPITPGNYPTENVAFTPATYTNWAQEYAAQILDHIDHDLNTSTTPSKASTS